LRARRLSMFWGIGAPTPGEMATALSAMEGKSKVLVDRE
jgi:hypothetical protein